MSSLLCSSGVVQCRVSRAAGRKCIRLFLSFQECHDLSPAARRTSLVPLESDLRYYQLTRSSIIRGLLDGLAKDTRYCTSGTACSQSRSF